MYKKGVVFSAACLGILLFGISLITLGSVGPDLKARFLLEGKTAGLLFSILPVGILTGSLIFGPICDRYGYKLIIVIACLAMFAGFQGIAAASTIAILKICIYVFGVGGGIVNGATNAVVADISEQNKGSNLSLLGVFFGLGALGMPLLLGLLSNQFSSFQVIAGVGWLTLVTGIWYSLIRFPPAKHHPETISVKWSRLFDLLLVLIAFFLFFQSGLESIINNWTTTYLATVGHVTERNALYALSLHVIGMIVMRLLTGTVFRKVSLINIMWSCLILLMTGILLMKAETTYTILTVGLFLSGAGLAGGFPIMLGFVGERFARLSGTAFSFVFTVALIGNMLISYLMGLIVHTYGVTHLVTFSFVATLIMAGLCFFIFKKIKSTNKK